MKLPLISGEDMCKIVFKLEFEMVHKKGSHTIWKHEDGRTTTIPQKRYHEARMERDKELYERQIRIVDTQIDRLVYDLYGLTEEEVKVVEGE